MEVVIKIMRGKLNVSFPPADGARRVRNLKLQVQAVAMTIVNESGRAMMIEDTVSGITSTISSSLTINIEEEAGTARAMTRIMIVVVDPEPQAGVYMTVEIAMIPEEELANKIRWQP